MPLNAQQKGKEGEREIARDLNLLVDDCLRELGLPPQNSDKPRVQRNQNQSAVGGCDLVGTFEIAIEIKRQEQLSINSWWTQCVASADKLGHHPVLLFRQNTPGGGRKNWRVITLVDVAVPGSDPVMCRGELSYDDFKRWFRAWALEHLRSEHRLQARPTVQLIQPKVDDDLPEILEPRCVLPDLYA